MKVLVEFISMSENIELKDISNNFLKVMPDCIINYYHKGDYKNYTDGRKSKLPIKNSELHITNKDPDYNNTIIKMLDVYSNLIDYFNQIEHHTFINLSFYSNDMFSLEFGTAVLDYLRKYNFSLPISCYKED